MSGNRAHTVIDSPYDELTLVANDGILCGLYMRNHRHQPASETFGERDDRPFQTVVAQLNEYFEGSRTDFDLPLFFHGTEFQHSVWAALKTIPYGTTLTYGELAKQLGKPAASRAVGLANGKNPISIIVPCHRVIGSSGNLTGYGGGLDRKRKLLAFESANSGLTLY